MVILRLVAPYGPGQRNRLVPGLISRVQEGRPVTLREGGRPRMNPIFVEDVAEVFAQALQHPCHPAPPARAAVNVGGDEVLSIREMGETIGQACGREPVFEEAPSQRGRCGGGHHAHAPGVPPPRAPDPFRRRGASHAGEMSGERLRILHVITSLARGGAQAHLLELLRGQKARGHEVELAYFKDPEMVPDFAPVVGFPFALEMEDLASAALLGRLWGLVSAVKPDVLHTHLLKADSYGAVVGRFGAAGATVASKHNDESALQRPWVARLHGILSRLDDRIIVCSDHVGRYMVQTGRAPAQKMRLVYYGIDLDRPLALSQRRRRRCAETWTCPPAGPSCSASPASTRRRGTPT